MIGRAANFFLALEAGCWHAARAGGDAVEVRDVAFDTADGAASAAGEVAAALQQLGRRAEAVRLGLPSEMVFSASIDSSDLPRRQRRATMLYRLEEQLPLDAERVTVDFLATGGGRCMGLAVETQKVAALVEALAAAGVEVAGIVPTALAALWRWRTRGNGPCAEDYCLVGRADRADAFRLDGDRPVAWYCGSGSSPDELAGALSTDQLLSPAESARPTACVLGEIDPDVLSGLAGQAGLEVRRAEARSAVQLAAEAGADDERAGWVDFRRDGLAARNPWGRSGALLRLVAVLGMLLPAVLAGACYWRTTQFRAATDAQLQRQRGIHREIHPTGSVPADVRSRLESELARLSAVSGAHLAETAAAVGALDCLRQVCTGLPRPVRLRISQLRVDPRAILLEGQARSHTDAETIARSLSRAGFAMDPARTEILVRGGVSFTITGKPVVTTAAAGSAGGASP